MQGNIQNANIDHVGHPGLGILTFEF